MLLLSCLLAHVHLYRTYSILCVLEHERIIIICIIDDVKVILNEGMPHYKNPFDKGRLIVNFKVNCYITV